MTLENWDNNRSLPEGHVELVRGEVVVGPAETVGTRLVVAQVRQVLSDALPAGWRAVTDVQVTVDPVAPTVRRPDVVVLAPEVDAEVPRIDPPHVALAVEVMTPETYERDWVEKRAEYAAAGIASYLIVDADGETLTAFTEPGATGYKKHNEGRLATREISGVPVQLDAVGLIVKDVSENELRLFRSPANARRLPDSFVRARLGDVEDLDLDQSP